MPGFPELFRDGRDLSQEQLISGALQQLLTIIRSTLSLFNQIHIGPDVFNGKGLSEYYSK